MDQTDLKRPSTRAVHIDQRLDDARRTAKLPPARFAIEKSIERDDKGDYYGEAKDNMLPDGCPNFALGGPNEDNAPSKEELGAC